MSNVFQYHPVHPTSWVYLSSLLTIGLFFKFNRLWSVRNLDLIGLILLGPGLLMVNSNTSLEQSAGYIWLFAMTGLFLVRMLVDPMMVRRPLLEPNLSAGGMIFIGTALLIFLMANVIKSEETSVSRLAKAKLAAAAAQVDGPPSPQISRQGYIDNDAGNVLLQLPPLMMQVLFARQGNADVREAVLPATIRTMAILSHIAVVIGMVVIGYRHFDNIKLGIAAATMYLLVPYTAQMTGLVDHALPAALIVWAVEAYRRPMVAGMFVALAAGAMNGYALYLLPLWLGFYWQRGLIRFMGGVMLTLGAVVVVLALRSPDVAAFKDSAAMLFGWTNLSLDGAQGFWGLDFIDRVYRVPVIAAFYAMTFGFALWPAQKNYGTLLSCSAAVMLGAQFWHAYEGGLYMAWYLPLLLLTIFRPNLEDRLPLTMLTPGWSFRRRAAAPPAAPPQPASA